MTMNKILCVLTVAVPLYAQDVSKQGSLTIRTDPSGVEVYLDSTRIGMTPLSKVSVPPGDHRLSLFYPSASAWNSLVRRETLTVHEGEELEKSFEFGSHISLSSIPSGSKVLLQGKELGMTPLFFRSASRLNGDLILEKVGYERAVVPLSGGSTSTIVSLRRSQIQEAGQDVVFDVPSSNDSKRWATYLSAGGMVASGIAAAYFKERANKRFDLYLQTRNPSYLASTQRNDRRSAVAFFLTQVGFGLLTYFLLSE